MADKMKKFEDLEKERKKLEMVADDHLKHLKSSFSSVKTESKSVMVNKVLIPAGIALVAGYGLKKLIDYIQSDDEPTAEHPVADSGAGESPAHRIAQSADSGNGGLLSGINWSAMAIQVVPFIIKVGQRLYEDGNLPWFKPPDYVEEEIDS